MQMQKLSDGRGEVFERFLTPGRCTVSPEVRSRTNVCF